MLQELGEIRANCDHGDHRAAQKGVQALIEKTEDPDLLDKLGEIENLCGCVENQQAKLKTEALIRTLTPGPAATAGTVVYPTNPPLEETTGELADDEPVPPDADVTKVDGEPPLPDSDA